MTESSRIKLAIFGSSNFLGWSKPFNTRIFTGSNTNPALSSKIMFRLQYKSQMQRLINWSDIIYCEFLSPLARTVSHISKKPIFIRIHRGELDQMNRFKGVNWENVASIVADSNAYVGFIKEIVPSYVRVLKYLQELMCIHGHSNHLTRKRFALGVYQFIEKGFIHYFSHSLVITLCILQGTVLQNVLMQ